MDQTKCSCGSSSSPEYITKYLILCYIKLASANNPSNVNTE